MKFVNLTPHIVRLNDGREFPPSGTIARVSSSYTEFDADGICRVEFGEITGLPAAHPCERCEGCGQGAACGTVYIVSGLVMSALGGRRSDVVSPATGHPDCIRKDGQVWSVPGFIRA